MPADLLEFCLSSMALGIALFALFAVVVKRVEGAGTRALHLDAMAVFLSIQAIDMVDSVLWSGMYRGAPLFEGTVPVLYPLFMASLWLFVRALTEPDARVRRRDWRHLVPFAVGLVALLPALSLSPLARRGLIDGDIADPETLHGALAMLGTLVFWGIWIVTLSVYSVLCARRLLQHRRNIRALYSDLDGKSLWWLTGLVLAILGLAWSVVLEEFSLLLFNVGFISGWKNSVQEVLISALMGFFALRAEPALPSWAADVLCAPDTAEPVTDTPTTPEAASAAPTTTPVHDGRYARSGLDEERLERLRQKTATAMERDRLWKQQGLRLKDLADVAGITPIHLSEVLNTGIGQTFYDYVNGYRVREACTLLSESDDTVLAIAETVGFTSKSTFNSQFKRITGRTPSQWRADAARACPAT